MKRKERKKRKQNHHALRAQAESRGDKVAVCWYDQFYDMSRRWTNRRATRQDQTEGKKKKKRRGQRHRAKKTKPKPKTKPAFLCPAGGARTAQETQGKAETDITKQNNSNIG